MNLIHFNSCYLIFFEKTKKKPPSNIEDVCRTCSSFESEVDSLEFLLGDLERLLNSPLSSLYTPFHHLIYSLLSFVHSQSKHLNPEDFEKNSGVFKGKEIIGLLATANVTFENFPKFFSNYQSLIERSSSQGTHVDLKLNPISEKTLECTFFSFFFPFFLPNSFHNSTIVDY